jgi:hypothetical protein
VGRTAASAEMNLQQRALAAVVQNGMTARHDGWGWVERPALIGACDDGWRGGAARRVGGRTVSKTSGPLSMTGSRVLTGWPWRAEVGDEQSMVDVRKGQ